MDARAVCREGVPTMSARVNLQFEDSKVGKKVVRAVVELLSEVVVKDVQVLRVVSVDARDELFDVLGSGRWRDPLGSAGGFGSHDVDAACEKKGEEGCDGGVGRQASVKRVGPDSRPTRSSSF